MSAAASCHSQRVARPTLEVADIFRAHGERYRHTHSLTQDQSRVMWCMEACRTAVLGGHVDACEKCDYERPSYNACRNRHCNKCQCLAQAKWISKRQERILPTHYFHVVFTLPQELRRLCKTNPQTMYDVLFASAAQTLLAVGKTRMSAQLGITAVLHTWSRRLTYHPHVHCIVTGGGLDVENEKWVATKKRLYLFPQRVMSNLFRGKFLAAVQTLRDSGQLDDKSIREFHTFKDALYKKDWVVHCKAPFGGPTQVFNYLGRYTHRVGISNQRLVRMDDDGVRFRTRDGDAITIAPEEFIRRYLLHVLPKGFVKIRHFGLCASINATTRLEKARSLIDGKPQCEPAAASIEAEEETDFRAEFQKLTGIDLTRCPRCTATLVVISLEQWAARKLVPRIDSS